jgi:threonine aldolase
VQTLSNITLVPLAPGKATFTLDETQRSVSEARGGRVLSPVSVISIETPVRRRFGESFNAAQMTQIVDLARKEGIRLHLDGARLFLEAAYTRRPLGDYAKLFDTVYVSLYKYFNAAGGAILAGPRALLDDIYHVRRMYGGGLYHAWPYAAVALHYLEGFEQRYARAVAASEEFIQGVGRIDGITVDRIPSGTHLFRLRIARSDPAALRMRLAGRGIALPGAGADGTMVIGVNESWNRTTAAELVDAFRRETAA